MRVKTLVFQMRAEPETCPALLDALYVDSDDEMEIDGRELSVRIREHIDNETESEPASHETCDSGVDMHFGLFVWPCARLLSQYLAHLNATLLRDKYVLELGCGPALPGIVAALCGNPSHVLMQLAVFHICLCLLSGVRHGQQ